MGIKDRDYYWEHYENLLRNCETPWQRRKRLVVSAMREWFKHFGL